MSSVETALVGRIRLSVSKVGMMGTVTFEGDVLAGGT
jgi:hypothetical protein